MLKEKKEKSMLKKNQGAALEAKKKKLSNSRKVVSS